MHEIGFDDVTDTLEQGCEVQVVVEVLYFRRRQISFARYFAQVADDRCVQDVDILVENANAVEIIFIAPKFDKDKKLVSPAYVTVFHNGVLVQNHTKFLGPTKHKQNTSYTYHEDKLPMRFQDHGNPTRFRNIWVRNLD